MTDIFSQILENINEHPFYKFNYLSYPEGYLPSEIDFSDIDNIIKQITEPDGIDVYRFLAIGNSYIGQIEIESILDEIERTGKLKEKEKLDKFFGYDTLLWGKLENVKFIPYKFSSTQSIFLVKNILSNYLFNKLPNKQLFTKENAFLFTFTNRFNEKSKIDLLSILNKKFIEGNLKYNKESAAYELSNFFIPFELIDQLSNLPVNELISELEGEKYDVYFQLKDRYINCGYRIQDKFLNEIASMPLPIDYMDKEINIKNPRIDPFNTNKIIRDITDNNNFYFYLFNNFVSILEDKKFNENFKRFFPLINDKNYKKVLESEVVIEDEESILELRKSYDKVSTIEEIFNGYNPETEIIETDFDYFTIKHSVFFPNNYELINMFNDIKLSFDIPFMKFKDPLTKEIVYKIYKPITQTGGPGFLPIVSKDELTDWIKYYGYDIEGEKIVPLKTNPRELSLKIKIFDYPESNIYNEGIIRRVNVFRETTYDIEYDEVIIPNVSLSFLKTKKDYNVGDTVNFKRYKTKYADVNISLRGNITFIIDLSDIDENNALDMDKIIAKYNEFLIMIYNLESMNNVLNFQVKISNNDLTMKGDLSNLIMGVAIEEFDKPIIYSRLFSLLSIFYPYLVYDEIAFKPDEDVEFFNGKEWVNAKVKEFIDDRIKISIYDPKKGIRKETEEIVDRKYIRGKEDILYRRFFNLRYKRVSNFDGGNAIRNLIMKLNSSNLPKSTILEKVEETFGISRELALKKLGDVMETEGKTIEKIRGNIGIGISIDWIKPKEKKYEIRLDNIGSLGDLRYVLKIIKLIFDIYKFLYNEVDNDYLEVYREFLENQISQNIVENINEQEKLGDLEQDENKGIEEELFRETEGDVFDVFGEIEEVEEEIVPLEEKKEDLRKDIDKEYREEILLVEGKHSSNNVILEKLYEVDPELFDWKADESKTYSKMCQRIKRYPKVLNEKTKLNIDSRDRSKKGKSSYATTDMDIDCANPSDVKYGKTKCKAIKWGSNDENKHWYICPRIWDMYDQISLGIEDLEFEIDGFESLDPETDNWRTDKNTTVFNDKKQIVRKGKDITEFNPTYKGRTYFDESRQKIAPTPTRSLLFMPKGENYSYPGFLNPSSHPKNLYVPCCFQDKSMRVGEAFGKLGDLEKNASKYIQNWGKELAPNRIGLIPPKLRKFFEIDGMTSYTTGEMTSDKTAYFRRGIKQGNDMFLNLVGDLLGEGISADQIKTLIIENLDEEVFNTLNRGNLSTWFLNNSICSSFQNFLEYTLSDLEKKWEFYFDLISRPNKWLFPNGLNMIILDYITQDSNEIINVLCTEYLCNKSWDEKSPIVIILKYKSIMEPIYFFNGNITPVKFVSVSKAKILELSKICHESGLFIGYSIVNKNFSKKHDSIMGYNFKEDLTLNVVLNDFSLEQIKNIVIDNYNKVIGIVLINNLYIPIFPSQIDLKLNKPVIMIDNLKDKLKFEVALDLYSKQDLKYNLVPLILMYRLNKDRQKVVNGFISQYGLVIPIADTIIDSKIEKVINYFEADKAIKSYREKLLNSSYNDPDTLEIVKDIVNGLELITDEYSITKYLTDSKNYLIGLIINCSESDVELIVPVKKINSRDDRVRLLLTKLEEVKQEEFEISNLLDYIDESGKIKRLTGYELQVLPLRGIMEGNKKYNKIILESGIVVKLGYEIDILEKDEDKYIINEVAENFVANSIGNLEEKEYVDLDNEMIRNVLIINYKKNILDSLRIQIANFINKIENREIKNLMKVILDDIKLTNSQKREIILIIIKYLYSILVKDSTLVSYPKVDTEIVLYSLTEMECRDLGWTSYSVPEVVVDFEVSGEREFTKGYINELEKILERSEYGKICRLLINSEYKNNFIVNITDELIRNRYRREQILNNKNLKQTTDRYKWNKNIEIVIEGNQMNNELIAELYMILKQSFFTKYFPFEVLIEIPKITIDSRPIIFKIKNKIGEIVKNIEIEKINELEINRNRVNLQIRELKLKMPNIRVESTTLYDTLKIQ